MNNQNTISVEKFNERIESIKKDQVKAVLSIITLSDHKCFTKEQLENIVEETVNTSIKKSTVLSIHFGMQFRKTKSAIQSFTSRIYNQLQELAKSCPKETRWNV